MSSVLTVPGVYFEPKPRAPELPFVRTDVAGFIGFEPRVRDGTTPSQLTGAPIPTGHKFQIDISAFTLEDPIADASIDTPETGLPVFLADVPTQTDFVLSESPASTLLADLESTVFGLAAVEAALQPFAVSGNIVAGPSAPAPSRTQIGAAVRAAFGSDLTFERIADVQIARVADTAVVTVRNQGATSRVTDGSAPSRFTGGSPPTGHEFQINIQNFDLVVGGIPMKVASATNFTLSANPASTLLNPGETIAFAIAEIRTGPGLVSAQGSIVPTAGTPAPAPADSVLDAAVAAAFGPAHDWRRIADIEYQRTGPAVRTTIRPVLPPAPCEDFRDYVRRMGEPIQDGTLLGAAVRAFFANGGGKCWVTTVRRPSFDDPAGLDLAREEMIGQQGSSEREATGLERLLLVDEVSILEPADLYARHLTINIRTVDLPPTQASACFQRCDRGVFGSVTATASRSIEALDPLFDDDSVFDAQRRMLLRVIPDRWRAFLLLTAPLELDPSDGKYHGPTVDRVTRWRDQFFGLAEEDELSCGGMYFPWVLSQEKTGDPVFELPPTPFVAGVMARRDLARGPQVSPANETVRAVVGITRSINDDIHGVLYAPPRNINVLRPFPGFGIQVWGARTLSNDLYLRYVSVRRTLSAIERRVEAALEDIVFEPNTPILWLRATQIVFQVLTPLFESGALRGDTPEQAFLVRCDSSNNPREAIEQGQLLIEVGVAIAAPAEFIVFRVGRKEGVVEVLE